MNKKSQRDRIYQNLVDCPFYTITLFECIVLENGIEELLVDIAAEYEE